MNEYYWKKLTETMQGISIEMREQTEEMRDIRRQTKRVADIFDDMNEREKKDRKIR